MKALFNDISLILYILSMQITIKNWRIITNKNKKKTLDNIKSIKK